ncbi:hypothetical protein ScPMuIL_003049 [Solemya velum]
MIALVQFVNLHSPKPLGNRLLYKWRREDVANYVMLAPGIYRIVEYALCWGHRYDPFGQLCCTRRSLTCLRNFDFKWRDG